MKHFVASILATVLLEATLASAATQAPEIARAEKPDIASLRYGLLIHFGIDTFGVYDGATKRGQIPAERFAPSDLDVHSWAQVARQAGMTFAVLTVKHQAGFCLWPSKAEEYSVASSPVKTDIVGDFIAACKTEGLIPGVLYSVLDAYSEGVVRWTPVSPGYFNLVKKQVTELHTSYPGIRVQAIHGIGRFSPSQFREICEIIKRLNPQCVITAREGEGSTGRNAAYVDVPWGQATVNKGFMWQANAEITPVKTIYEAYALATAKRNAFLLNVGPDRTGRIPADYVAVLMEMKKMIASTPTKDPAPAPSKAKPSAVERLTQVKELYGKGLISKEEYDLKVKEIMDSL